MKIEFDQNNPEATANALVEVLRMAVLNNIDVSHDLESGCYTVASQTAAGRSRVHQIGYEGEVTVLYEDLLEDEDLT